MKNSSRSLGLTALILVMLLAACAAEDGTSSTTTVGTILPDEGGMTGTPPGGTVATETATGGLETATGVTDPGTPTADATQGVGTQAQGTGVTRTPGIPVTGADVMLVECQFCVDTRAHALIVLPDTATFQITSPAASTTGSTSPDDPHCSTVEVNNGRQVVLCSGPEMTPLLVNICTGAGACTDLPVDLLSCPSVEGGSVRPSQTQPAAATATGGPTAVSGTATATSPGVVISTATPLETATTTP